MIDTKESITIEVPAYVAHAAGEVLKSCGMSVAQLVLRTLLHTAEYREIPIPVKPMHDYKAGIMYVDHFRAKVIQKHRYCAMVTGKPPTTLHMSTADTYNFLSIPEDEWLESIFGQAFGPRDMSEGWNIDVLMGLNVVTHPRWEEGRVEVGPIDEEKTEEEYDG